MSVPGKISIHAPRVGGDVSVGLRTRTMWIFQSTPPVWGATNLSYMVQADLPISIHAPRVGGDINTPLVLRP